jgi:hypothetical protein
MSKQVAKGQKIKIYTELLNPDKNTYMPFYTIDGTVDTYNKKTGILTINIPQNTYEYPIEAFSPEHQANIMEMSQTIQHTPIYLTKLQFNVVTKETNIPNMRITKTVKIVGGQKTKRKQPKKINIRRRTAYVQKKCKK